MSNPGKIHLWCGVSLTGWWRGWEFKVEGCGCWRRFAASVPLLFVLARTCRYAASRRRNRVWCHTLLGTGQTAPNADTRQRQDGNVSANQCFFTAAHAICSKPRLCILFDSFEIRKLRHPPSPSASRKMIYKMAANLVGENEPLNDLWNSNA